MGKSKGFVVCLGWWGQQEPWAAPRRTALGISKSTERSSSCAACGPRVPVEPKVFDLLSYFVAHRDRVIPKDELFAQLWPNEFVTDSALTYCVRAARKALGDDGKRQRFIQTVHGRGYRFVADVQPVSRERSADEHQVPESRATTVFVGRAGRWGS